jgi:hypothetical protein
VGREQLENLQQMKQVLLIRGAVYQDIVKEHQDKLPKEWRQCRVHSLLKGSWSTCQPKRHHPKFKLTKVGLKRHFVLLLGLEQNLMQPRAQIQLGKLAGLSQLIKQLIYNRTGNFPFSVIALSWQ